MRGIGPALALAGWVGMLCPLPVAAACPPDSEEVSRTTAGNQIRFRCRCLGEKIHSAGQCLPPEAAPLDRQALAIVTGAAFSAADALRAYARQQSWRSPAPDAWDFSTLEAEFGRYKRARKLLEFAQSLTGEDDIAKTFSKSLSVLEQRRAQELENFFQKYPPDLLSFLLPATTGCGPDCDFEGKAHLFDRVLSEANFERETGAYETAIQKFRDARRIAELSGFEPRFRKLANEGIVWTRQLRASWEEHNIEGVAETAATFNNRRRQEIVAVRAEILASHLSAAGKGDVAIVYLKRAREHYLPLDPDRAALVEKRIEKLEADNHADLSLKGGEPLTIYTNASSEAHIMLDAIEYGAGNWRRSIGYLEDALAADPGNGKILAALIHVKGLSATVQ